MIYSEDEEFVEQYEELVVKRAGDLAYKHREFKKYFLEAIKDGYFEIKHK